MKKCDKCFGSDGIVKCDMPENNFEQKNLYVCTRCGHTDWPDAEHAHAEVQDSSFSASGSNGYGPLTESAVGKCDKCLGSDDIVKCEAPENAQECEFLHICTRCGHAVWPDTENSTAGEQDSASFGHAAPQDSKRN